MTIIIISPFSIKPKPSLVNTKKRSILLVVKFLINVKILQIESYILIKIFGGGIVLCVESIFIKSSPTMEESHYSDDNNDNNITGDLLII